MTTAKPGTSGYYEDKALRHQSVGQLDLANQCRREAAKLRRVEQQSGLETEEFGGMMLSCKVKHRGLELPAVHSYGVTHLCRLNYGIPALVDCPACGAKGSDFAPCKGKVMGFHDARLAAAAKGGSECPTLTREPGGYSRGNERGNAVPAAFCATCNNPARPGKTRCKSCSTPTPKPN